MFAGLSVIFFLLPVAWAQSTPTKSCEVLDLLKGVVKRGKGKGKGKNCSFLFVPTAVTLGGEWCSGVLTHAGFYRSADMNPYIGEVLSYYSKTTPAPVHTASGDAGTLYAARYFHMRKTNVQKWGYPCYLLEDSYKTMCYYHGTFGRIADACEAETFSITVQTAQIVLGPLIMVYGGPMGVLSTYVLIKFGFLNAGDVPMGDGTTFTRSVPKLMTWSPKLRRYEGLGFAHTQLNPTGSGQMSTTSLPSYGYDSMLIRSISAISSNGQAQGATWYSNYSVSKASVISANSVHKYLVSPLVLQPKAMATSEVVTVFSQYFMITKLMATNTLMGTKDPPGCKTISCVFVGAGLTDSTGITTTLSYASKAPSISRPVLVMISGGTSTFASVKHLLGTGSLSLASMGSIGMCPFGSPEMCEMKEAMVPMMLSESLSVFKPQARAISTYCGDPVAFDTFEGACSADGLCHMISMAVPGKTTAIAYMVENPIFVLSMTFIDPTHLSKRFVAKYIPQKMLNQDYYLNMDQWFPNFDYVSPQKGGMGGGIGFTKTAGNALMDYMTYLSMRLVLNFVHVKTLAIGILKGMSPHCGYAVYEKVTEAMPVA